MDGLYRVGIDVKARELPGPLPLQLTVFHPGGRVNRQVTLPAEGGSFALDSKERPIRVEINADRGLLAKVEALNALRQVVAKSEREPLPGS